MNDEKHHNITHLFKTWKDLQAMWVTSPKADTRKKWVYRGQDSEDWDLKSTFERARDEHNIPHKSWEYEALILREFQRRAYHYTSNLPKSNDILEWFSLMRHYGAPSRLVDFTYSFYAAAYFAFKKVTPQDGKNAVIWAIRLGWLEEKFYKIFSEKRDNFRFRDPLDFHKHFLERPETPRDFVAPVNPFRMNHRLTAQQGLFLCPGNIEKSFMENLTQNIDQEDRKNIKRIAIPTTLKDKVLTELWYMNINSATLLPDLGGFAEYLSDLFYLPVEVNGDDLKSTIDGPYIFQNESDKEDFTYGI
jgi:hypothetical protein